MEGSNVTQQILAIQRDQTLTDAEKAKKRQAVLSGKWLLPSQDDSEEETDKAEAQAPAPAMFDDSLKCTMCMELCNRPVTAPCQHNFCLACFKKWTAQGKKTCPTCRNAIPAKFAANPRINTALTTAIRMAKQGVKEPGADNNFERIRDKDRPDEAFTTDRAVRAGRANAASGRIMVTVPNDHFGPIPPEADPRGLGVRVGESWKDRLDCRQWGAHFPHVAGIAGQSNVGAQSVVLSGGYEDDRDEGEWFLYTGSGGRDLSGNKRTNKEQSFDQKFESSNKALLVSCQKGLPVRVVRSHKEKRSAYAPTEEEPVRYDGIYRIARCWRKPGMQKFQVCRYLFVRCDNEPAPWSTEDVGDSAWAPELPAAAAQDMKEAKGTIYETAAQPWWDWDAEKEKWGWARAPPVSQKSGGEPDTPKKLRKKATEQERALREFMCKLCCGVLKEPVSTSCGHHFCRPCLEKVFQGQGDVLNRGAKAGRALRVQKVVKPCPTCKADLADFLTNCQVNRDMQVVIGKLQAGARKAQEVAAKIESPPPNADAAETLAQEVEDAEQMAEEGLASAGKGLKPPSLNSEQQPADEEGPEPKAALEAATIDAAATAADSAPAAAAQEPVPETASVSAQDAELSKLCQEFPDFDRGLIEGMLADQGGDSAEVHACLRRMAKQTAAAQKRAEAEARKGAKAAASAAVATETKPSGNGQAAAAVTSQVDQEESAKQGDAPAAVTSQSGKEKSVKQGKAVGSTSTTAAALTEQAPGSSVLEQSTEVADSVKPLSATAMEAGTAAASSSGQAVRLQGAAVALAKGGENQDMNSLAAADKGASGKTAGAKPRGRKRAADAPDTAGASKKANQGTKSTRSAA